MAQQPPQPPQQPQQPHQFFPTIAENRDNSFPNININMRQPMNMRQPPSSPNKLYELNDPKKTMLVYYFIKDDIKTPPKTGTITELPTLGMFGLGKYKVTSGNNGGTEKVEKVYTPDENLGKEGTAVEVVAGVGGRRRKSKKMYKNKNKKRKSRKSRKSSKRSRMH